MRIDGQALNPFRGLNLYGTQDTSQIPGVPGMGGEQSGPQFTVNTDWEQDEQALPFAPVSNSTVAMTDLAQRMDQLDDVNRLDGPDQAFALEMHRRLSASTSAEGEQREPDQLVRALSDAVGYIHDRHGREAATAAMGMILGSSGEYTSEESLSGGLVRVLEMVDRGFGIAAGDAAMAHFNGTLNQALNDHFENGLAERFMVKTEGMQGVSIAMDDVHERFARQVAEANDRDPQQKSMTEELLAEMAQELEETSPEALAEAEAKAGRSIEAMRGQGMGWGEIARELGLDPSSVGMGRIKQAAHEGEPVEFALPSETRTASLAESLVESTVDRLTARAREAYAFTPAPEPEFLSATV